MSERKVYCLCLTTANPFTSVRKASRVPRIILKKNVAETRGCLLFERIIYFSPAYVITKTRERERERKKKKKQKILIVTK